MKCKVCGSESGKYPLCAFCNRKKDSGEIIKCDKCGKWHYASLPCIVDQPENINEPFLYDLKKSLISKSEQGFFDAIKDSIPEGYFVFPQVNLAAFIYRTDSAKFQNELFRNVDFLVTDNTYKPKLIIEINDQTHLAPARKERDEKVRKICEEAGIPILKFWTSYGVNQEYIKGKITEILNNTSFTRVHHFDKTDSVQNITSSTVPKKKGACYIATCVYGSYDCPPVWVLRRYRDTILSSSFGGKLFIKAYYSISPIIIRLFGDSHLFKMLCTTILNRIVFALKEKGFADTPYTDNF